MNKILKLEKFYQFESINNHEKIEQLYLEKINRLAEKAAQYIADFQRVNKPMSNLAQVMIVYDLMRKLNIGAKIVKGHWIGVGKQNCEGLNPNNGLLDRAFVSPYYWISVRGRPIDVTKMVNSCAGSVQIGFSCARGEELECAKL